MRGLRRSRCAPGSAASPCARACCCAATAGWGEWSPFLEYDARGRRAVAALRRGGRGRGLAGAGPRPGARSTSPCRPSAPSEAHAIVAAGGCRTAKVKVAEPGQTLADDEARLEAVRDALGPGGRIRVDANGAWDVDDAVAAIARAGPGGRRAGVRRAAVRRASRTSPPYAAGSTCRSPPTSRSGGPRTPTGSATSRPPTSRCSRCSRSAGCAPACGSPRTSGCRSSCRRRWRPRSASRPGVALAAALPELPYACGLATVQLLTADVVAEPLLPGRRGRCRCGAPTVDDPPRSTGSPRPPTGSRTGRPGSPRCERCGRITPVNRRPSWPGRCSTALVEAGVTEVVVAPGSRNAPLSLRGVRRRRGRAGAAAHPDRRAHRRVPGARAAPRSAPAPR